MLIALTIVVALLVLLAAGWLVVRLVVGPLLRVMPDGRFSRTAGRLLIERPGAADERALRESEQHLALAQQAAHIGSWERDRGSGLGRWSDEHFRLLGYEPGEVEPSFEAFIVRVHPDDRERIVSAADGSWESDEPLELEYRLLLPDGSERLVETVSRVIRDGDGKPFKKLGVLTDVTERAATERALLESEQRFRVVLDTMQAAVLVTGPDMRPLIANRALVELLGYSEQELLALARDVDIVHPDDREALARLSASVRSGAMPSARVQCRLARKDGSAVNVEGSITPFTLDSGRQGLIFEATDVTARVTAERELRESREQLTRAQDVAHLGSWNWDLETDTVWWSDQMYRLHGWEPGDVPATFASLAELMSDEDAARLSAMLAAVARDGEPFDGVTAPVERIPTTGIAQVTEGDIRAARDLGCVIRLIASARLTDDGRPDLRVGPALLPRAHPLARIRGERNAIIVRGESCGELTFEGRGAGGGPTASAVISDLLDLAKRPRGECAPAWRIEQPACESPLAAHYARFDAKPNGQLIERCYRALRNAGITTTRFAVARRPEQTDGVSVSLVTRPCRTRTLADVMEDIAEGASTLTAPILRSPDSIPVRRSS